MSWSYDPTQLNIPKNIIRIITGDVLADAPLLQDEEIQYFLDQYPKDIDRAALACVNAIITRICSTPDYTLGPYSESNGNRLKAFQAIQADLSARVVGYNSPVAEGPTTGAIFGYDMMSVHCCVGGNGNE